jgi:capsule polysaccharide export protein KpsE/RkpR
MDQNDNKNNTPKVDEEYLMQAMAKGTRDPNLPSLRETAAESMPVIKDKSKAKKQSDVTYGERFLKSHSMNRRGEKSIYIRQEYHERLSRIVQVIGDDKIPLYAYLDNILEHHFELFEKAITDNFNDKFKPIF